MFIFLRWFVITVSAWRQKKYFYAILAFPLETHFINAFSISDKKTGLFIFTPARTTFAREKNGFEEIIMVVGTNCYNKLWAGVVDVLGKFSDVPLLWICELSMKLNILDCDAAEHCDVNEIRFITKVLRLLTKKASPELLRELLK